MKPKILFVDDEPNILDSLRLTLRPLRSKWDMSFVVGGKDGLHTLAQTPYDVVVSDMRMPGMDGIQFLSEVWRLYPETIRFILSGYSDEEQALKTAKIAQQFLTKPCRPVDLISAISNSLRLRDVMVNSHLKSVLGMLDSLPALPSVYSKLVTVLQNENVTTHQLADIVSQDVGICASILRLMNSSFFGLRTRVSDINHAVKLLGSHTLQVIVLSTCLFSTLKTKEIPGFSIKRLWEHSLRVGCCARAIGEKEGLSRDEIDDCFIAGILHDIGKLILATKMPQEFELVLSQVHAQNRPLNEIELEVLGTTHAEVGAYLMALWGFNNPSMDAVCCHHNAGMLPCECFSPVMTVMVANLLDHELVNINRPCDPHLLDEACNLHPLLGERLGIWREICRDILAEGAGHVE